MELKSSKFKGAKLLEGKRAVVTGAGSGFGKQIAYTLAEQGAKVVALDYNKESAEETAKEINGFAVVGDVSNFEQLKDVFNEIGDYFDGTIDIFVNNAGINIPCRIEDLELEKLNKMIDVNQKGTYFCASLAHPLLSKGKEPIFIMMGSSASVGSEGQGIYSGTKASLRGLLGTLVKEWKGIRVGLLEPDYFEETGLRSEEYLRNLADSRRTSVDKVSNDETVKKIQLGREGKIIEIAEKIVMMSLDTYASGNVEVLSGGKTIRI